MTGGGIAQLARVLGSYPIGRWFESCCRYHSWPVGQEVKTPPFHGGIMGSIPVRVTNNTSCLHVFFCDFFGPLVKRLRHRPFTAESWVRFPYGSPDHIPENDVFTLFSGFSFIVKMGFVLYLFFILKMRSSEPWVKHPSAHFSCLRNRVPS